MYALQAWNQYYTMIMFTSTLDHFRVLKTWKFLSLRFFAIDLLTSCVHDVFILNAWKINPPPFVRNQITKSWLQKPFQLSFYDPRKRTWGLVIYALTTLVVWLVSLCTRKWRIRCYEWFFEKNPNELKRIQKQSWHWLDNLR